MATANSRVVLTLSRLQACANRSLMAAGRQQGGKGGERLIWSCPGEPTSQPSQISLSPPLYSKHLMIINMLQMLKERWESLSYSLFLCLSLFSLWHTGAQREIIMLMSLPRLFLFPIITLVSVAIFRDERWYTHTIVPSFINISPFSRHIFFQRKNKGACAFL